MVIRKSRAGKEGGIKRVSSRRESKNQFDLFGNEEEKTGGDSDRRGWIKGKLEGGVDTRNTSSLSLSMDDEAKFASRQTSAIVVKSVATESVTLRLSRGGEERGGRGSI